MSMEENNRKYDCSRGCTVERTADNELVCTYSNGCCKRSVTDWMEGITDEQCRDLFEVRFKNTRKGIYRNTSGQIIKEGDFVVVEAATGHDVGIVTLEGAIVGRQMLHNRISPETYEFKKIYRKAKVLDLERWQEATALEHRTMIRSRQIAADLGLDMKIGDVEYQGDGTKAIFYYIADERVDFRQLIKVFAEEFRIRIEMKQIGARQEAGLIGGLGVCGRALCCSGHVSDFQSITTQAARCQDLSLNPQRLAGQCSKLKCCINYEAAVYVDAQQRIPSVREPLEFEDGKAYLVKKDILSGTMWFSFDEGNMSNMFPLTADQVREIIALNRKGGKARDPRESEAVYEAKSEFVSAVGDDSIERFDEGKRHKGRNRHHKGNAQGQKDSRGQGNDNDRGQKKDHNQNKPQGHNHGRRGGQNQKKKDEKVSGQ